MDIDQVADIKRHFLHFLLLSRKNTSPLPQLPPFTSPLLFPLSLSHLLAPCSLLLYRFPKMTRGKQVASLGLWGRGTSSEVSWLQTPRTCFPCYLLTSPWHLEGKSLFPSAAGEQLIPDPRFLQQDLDVLGFYNFFSLARPYLLLSGIHGKGRATQEWVSEGTQESQEFALEKFTICPTRKAGSSF